MMSSIKYYTQLETCSSLLYEVNSKYRFPVQILRALPNRYIQCMLGMAMRMREMRFHADDAHIYKANKRIQRDADAMRMMRIAKNCRMAIPSMHAIYIYSIYDIYDRIVFAGTHLMHINEGGIYASCMIYITYPFKLSKRSL